MRNTVVKLLGIIPLLTLTMACQKEDVYVMPKVNPVVKFNEVTQAKIAETYIENKTEDVMGAFSFMRAEKGKSFSFSIARIEANGNEPDGAFELTTTEVEYNSTDTLELKVGTIDWSKIAPGQKFEVVLTITSSDDIQTGPATSSMKISVEKPDAPLIWLDKDELYNAIIPEDYSEDTKTFTITLPVTSDEILEDISMPIRQSGAAQQGVHYIITDTVLLIAKGAQTADLTIEVLKDGFTPGEKLNFWIEIHEEDIPEGTLCRIDENYWWTTISVGLDGEPTPLIWLDKDIVYSALIPTDHIEETMDIAVKIDMTNDDITEDINMPFRLNEYNVQENTHFQVADKVLRLKAGEKSAELVITVIKSAFSAGEAKTLWIEIHKEDIPDGTSVEIDDTYWWTAIDIGRAL